MKNYKEGHPKEADCVTAIATPIMRQRLDFPVASAAVIMRQCAAHQRQILSLHQAQNFTILTYYVSIT